MFSFVKNLLTSGEARKQGSIFKSVEIPYYGLNEKNYLSALTKKLPLAAACIALRARKVRTTPWKLVNKKGEEVSKSKLPLLKNPNSFQTFEDLLELIVWRLDALGNAYLLKSGIRGTRFNGLYLLPADRITTFAFEEIFITKYEYRVLNGEVRELQPFELVHLKYPNPELPIYGLGLVQQAELLLQRNLNRDNYLEAFYKNGTVLSGIFTTDSASVGKEQIERMQTSFKQTMGGVTNFFKSFFVWAGFKFQPVATTQRDAQDVEQSKLTRDDILAVFGVPGALLGFTDGVNFSNAEIQERVFINNTLIPLLERLEQIINDEIISLFDENIRFEFLKPVNENLNLKSVWVSKAFQDNIISAGQYAQLMGVKADGTLQGKNSVSSQELSGV